MTKKSVYTGPGSHWKKLSNEERHAIGEKISATKRRNAANRRTWEDVTLDRDNLLLMVNELENLAKAATKGRGKSVLREASVGSAATLKHFINNRVSSNYSESVNKISFMVG